MYRSTDDLTPPHTHYTVAPGTKKVAPARKPAGTQKSAGFRKYEGDALWLPNTTRPDWLDGQLPGDRGFDPLGLAKPVSYLQYDLDQNDQVCGCHVGEVEGMVRSSLIRILPSTSHSIPPHRTLQSTRRGVLSVSLPPQSTRSARIACNPTVRSLACSASVRLS